MRRTFLTLIVALVASLGFAQSDNTLRAPLIGDPTAWPINPPGLISDIMIGKTLFNNLVRFSFDDGSTVVPDLAERWEVDADSRVWTFFLRDDVVWHDGEPFTADDVVFTVETIRNPDVASRWSAAFVTLETVEALDDHTVRMTFEAPFAPLLATLAYNLAIVPEHVLSSMDLSVPSGPTDFVTNPIGTGPFRFVEQVSGSHFILEANPDYHEGRPAIDRVEFKVVPDVNAQVAQLLTGELDITWTVEPIHYDRLAAASNIVLGEVNIPRFDWIPLNNENPLFQDARVRRAMAHALPRELMVDAVFGGFGEVATGPIPPSIAWVPRDQARMLEYDVELRARAVRRGRLDPRRRRLAAQRRRRDLPLHVARRPRQPDPRPGLPGGAGRLELDRHGHPDRDHRVEHGARAVPRGRLRRARRLVGHQARPRPLRLLPYATAGSTRSATATRASTNCSSAAAAWPIRPSGPRSTPSSRR